MKLLAIRAGWLAFNRIRKTKWNEVVRPGGEFHGLIEPITLCWAHPIEDVGLRTVASHTIVRELPNQIQD